MNDPMLQANIRNSQKAVAQLLNSAEQHAQQCNFKMTLAAIYSAGAVGQQLQDMEIKARGGLDANSSSMEVSKRIDQLMDQIPTIFKTKCGCK